MTAHIGRTRVVFRVAALLAAVGVSLVAGAAVRGDEPAPPAPPDIAMKLTLFPADGTITAREPLVLGITFTNQSANAIGLMLQSNVPTTYLRVLDSEGKVVAASPHPGDEQDRYGERISTGRALAPGESYTRTWAVSAFYQFTEPGDYSLWVQQLAGDKGETVIAEARAAVHVLPFDAARLDAACEELFQPLGTHSSHETDLPMTVRTRALWSVRDDVALPYLDWMACQWGDRYSCLAIRRIGTERARKLLDALLARHDRVGEAARQSLEMPLETSVWDVGD
jgi:hypothetical protein